MDVFKSFIYLLSVISLSSAIRMSHSQAHHVAGILQTQISGKVYTKGSYHYEFRRRVHNGLCLHKYPDLVVVPQSTGDVARTVRVARKHGLEISVRSGGHSFLCSSIKDEGIHLDMRAMNKVRRVGYDTAVLGPGSTWGRVLDILPPSHYTMVHGQCLSVGVGGYLVGGGINVVGTSEKYGSGGKNVVKFTMVTAEGDVAEVTRDNVTLWRNGRQEGVYEDSERLHLALGNAGSSFGIVTEFLYRVYPRPETLPAISIAYIETPYDLRRLEKAAADGRYHVSFFLPYIFNRSYSLETIGLVVGITMLPPFLRFLQNRRIDPVFVVCVDNRGIPKTDRGQAYRFLESYGLRLAKEDNFAANIIPEMFGLDDYETVYMTKEQIRRRGYQGVESANLMGLNSLRVLDKFIFDHPVFGFKHKYSPTSMRAGCDFCYFIVVSTSKPERPILDLTDTGRFQIELTCTYEPNRNRACPRVLKNAKEKFVRWAIELGEGTPTQYANTPSCDVRGDFGHRYYGDNYEWLLEMKQRWDPDNFFHHCQSIGNDDQNCCPQK